LNNIKLKVYIGVYNQLYCSVSDRRLVIKTLWGWSL
jgi:hypothetical protein